jgi:DNA-binding SARP family transcriptional activator/tetratricopeptide (TPR) repeat protein
MNDPLEAAAAAVAIAESVIPESARACRADRHGRSAGTLMWIGLLGSLRVRVDGAAVAVPAARQRALLAVLAVRAGELVSTDELAETVWDGMPPARAADTIRNYVKRLRLRLGTAGRRIVACRPGYRLEVAEDEVDLRLFTRLCRDGGVAVRAGDWGAAFGGLGQALGLWRGAPFADAGCERLQRERLPLLSELRWQAAEWRAEAGLALGRHAELMGELAGWCAAEPLRERLAALRMLALYRSGRQSAALAAYQQARRMLADELGVEPGEELRRLQQQILARDPALAGPAERDTVPGGGCVAPASEAPAEGADVARVVPRQLPAAVAGFVGRSGELAVLAGLAEQAVGGAGGAVLISAIGGMAGVGKTALAVRFAHQVAGLFPDGQLYADLRGFSPAGDPAASGQVLRGFLEALGVAPRAVPADAEAQAGLYRSVLAGKRVLVVLDNARDAAQVRPLVPGSAGCLVLVTSRSQLTGLVATGDARLLSIGLLTEQEARELLAGRAGAGRVEAEPQAADELIRLCARLPLALAITAARAAARLAHPLAALAAELREAGGLDALDAGEPAASVRAVFSWSYEQLSLPAAGLFRLLGIHPGPDISAPAAASLAGVEPARARQVLAELAGAHLIAEHAPGRFAFHDLLRAYATEQAHAVDGDAERRAATGRMLDHYLSTAYAAAVLVNPSCKSLSIAPPEPGVTSEHLAGQRQALAWFEAEHRVLLAAAARAAEAGFDRHAWQLPWALGDYLDSRGHWHTLVTVQRSALAAATRLGDVGGQAAAHRALAGACTQLATYDVAHAHLADSLELYRRLGDRAGEARVHLTLGWVFACQERYADALGSSEQALSLFQAIGGQVGQARALHQVGWCGAQLGRHQEARAFCRRALALLRELGHRGYEAESWHNLGDVEQKCGDHLAAAACYQRALGLFREFGDRYSQAMVLTHLGDAQHAAGQTHAARTAWHEAVAILDALHHADAGQVRAKLGQDAEPSQTR